jgi:hypothetical protein
MEPKLKKDAGTSFDPPGVPEGFSVVEIKEL